MPGSESNVVEVERSGLEPRTSDWKSAAGRVVRDGAAYGKAQRQRCEGGSAKELSAIDVARHGSALVEDFPLYSGQRGKGDEG